MLNFNSGSILFLLNHLGAFFADHHGRGVGVAGRDVGHNRSIGDSQVFDSVDAQFRIHDRFSVDTLAGLRRLQARGELKLDGEWSPLQNAAAFEDWLQPLESIQCVTYIQAPPTPDTSPDQVLKYLARYMTGGPISDRRLLRHEHGHVTFSARKGTQAGGDDADDVEEVTLPGVEFVRRWAMHILPKGYTKTRRFGGYSNHHRKRYIAACRELLPTGELAPETLPAIPIDAGLQEYRCPKCESLLTGTLLTLTSRTDRPGWQTVMSGPQRPDWYDDG
jgi:hypothetical protein